MLSDEFVVEEPRVNEDPWLTIDLQHTPPVSREIDTHIISPETTADLMALEPVSQPNIAAHSVDHQPELAIPAEIAQRLQSADSSERAAALVDLADAGDDTSFALITKSFDDPSIEVRNAAARALHSLQPDLAASFTRALREATPERRRKIGAAIAGSGLAANAINSLAGEGRDRTYDAFSILFLMAKAGEVQPLMNAIAKHSNIEVRLTAAKLIGLSNQQQVLPGLRSMASRDQLPAEVHTAVMEAIYLLSNQTREVA
jgi:HEAT repeat protein